MSKINILLLGGTGTLSSAVMHEALHKGYSVTIMNRGIRKKNVPNGVEQLTCDFKNGAALESIFTDRKFDVIVDFLSRKKEDIERVYPIFSTKCQQYIFISSACVYRRALNDFPILETSPMPNNDWQYNIEKYECEKKLIELSRIKDSVYTIIRPYITYDDERIPLGLTPSYHYHRTIIERLREGKPWFVWDEGRAITTLTHTDDFAQAMVGLFLNINAYNEDFHITSGYQCTQLELVELLFNKLGLCPNIISFGTSEIVNTLPEYRGLLMGDRSLDAVFDNSKIINAVPGLSFDIDIEQGIERILNYWAASSNYDYDYRFDAKIDRLIGKCTKVNYIRYRDDSSNSRFVYYCYRYLPLKIATRLMR